MSVFRIFLGGAILITIFNMISFSFVPWNLPISNLKMRVLLAAAALCVLVFAVESQGFRMYRYGEAFGRREVQICTMTCTNLKPCPRTTVTNETECMDAMDTCSSSRDCSKQERCCDTGCNKECAVPGNFLLYYVC